MATWVRKAGVVRFVSLVHGDKAVPGAFLTLRLAQTEGLQVLAAVAPMLPTLPFFGTATVADRLTLLMLHVLLAVSWNLRAGFAGLASVGPQTVIGQRGNGVLRLVEAGLPPSAAPTRCRCANGWSRAGPDRARRFRPRPGPAGRTVAARQ